MSTQSIILVRHALAAGALSGPDRERPLSREGVAQLPRLSAWVQTQLVASKAIGRAPRLLRSPAKRTVQTSEAIADATSLEAETVNAIYEASLHDLLAVLTEHDRPAQLILVGHNPGLSELTSYLSGHRLGLMPADAVHLLRDGNAPFNAKLIDRHDSG